MTDKNLAWTSIFTVEQPPVLLQSAQVLQLLEVIMSKTFKNIILKSLSTSRHLWTALIQWVLEKSIAQPVPGLHWVVSHYYNINNIHHPLGWQVIAVLGQRLWGFLRKEDSITTPHSCYECWPQSVNLEADRFRWVRAAWPLSETLSNPGMLRCVLWCIPLFLPKFWVSLGAWSLL